MSLESAIPFANKGKRFTPYEDMMLKQLVQVHGEQGRWSEFAKVLGRTGKQCRERYKNYLAPQINKIKWTKDEDQMLLKKYLEFGPKWRMMTPFFHGRSDVCIKNRFISVILRKCHTIYVAHNRKNNTSSESESSDSESIWDTILNPNDLNLSEFEMNLFEI